MEEVSVANVGAFLSTVIAEIFDLEGRCYHGPVDLDKAYRLSDYERDFEGRY